MLNKRYVYTSLICLIVILLGVVCYFGGIMKKSEVDHYKPYSFSLETLSNGLEVLLIKDDALPTVSFDMMFKVGSRMDPKDKEGLLSLLVDIIDKGTKKRSPVKIVEDLEVLGTSFLYSLGKDSLFFSVETLSWLNEDILKIFSEIITEPAFLEKEFQRAKEKSIAWVERSTENFSSYSSRVFNKYLYESHPYGFYQNGSLSGLKNISLIDVKEFYNQYFHPQQALLSVSGRYPDNIIEILEKYLGKWKKPVIEEDKDKKMSVSVVPSVKKTKEVLLVNNMAAIQSEIRIGHVSVSRSHPDYLPLLLANVILGGSFNSRLMHRIRSQKGLTYSISSRFSLKKELGTFKLGFAVRNNKVGESLLEVMGVLENFYKNGITEMELKKAKQLLKNQFITGVSSADSFAHFLMYLNSHNIPYSYVEDYFSNINSTSLDAVNTAIKKHIHLNKFKILILSHADKIKSQLIDFPSVTVKDYKSFL